MKRYMCTRKMTDTSTIKLTQGKIYEPSDFKGGLIWIMDDAGRRCPYSQDTIGDWFKELPDPGPLPPDVSDHESEQYQLLEPEKGCARGMATAAAIIISIVAILYSIFA